MIIEAGFVALLVAAWKKAGTRGVMTPERQIMFHEALENIRGTDAPRMFRKLADGWEKFGFPLEAKILRTRADYLDAPEAVKVERQAIIAKAMLSVNADAVDGVAFEFERLTATGVARDLRMHSKEIREGKFPVVTPPPAETVKPPVKKKTNGHIQTKADPT